MLYGLPRDVFVAFDGRYSVWLNVRRDRYFAIERHRTAAFHELVRGWPGDAGWDDCAGAVGASPIAQLLKSGLLVELHREPGAKAVSPAAASRLAGEIGVPALAPRASIRAHHVRNLARASITAATTLKWRGLASAVSHMTHGQNSDREASRTEDREALSQLISAFALLRPFFFASRNRCLLTALALSKFLVNYAIRPQCVIGVHARPFSAHCWLEHEQWVLNDTVERVRRYTPILRV
jgi:hypothetical protein